MKVNKSFYKGVAGGVFALLLLCTSVRAEVFTDFAQVLEVVSKTAVSPEKSEITEESFKDLKINYDTPEKMEEMKKIFEELTQPEEEKPAEQPVEDIKQPEEEKSKTESEGEEELGISLVPVGKEQSSETQKLIEEKKETEPASQESIDKLVEYFEELSPGEAKKEFEKLSKSEMKEIDELLESIEQEEEIKKVESPSKKTTEFQLKEKNNSKIYGLEDYAQWKKELIEKDQQLIKAIKTIPLLQRDNVLLTALFGEKEPVKILAVTEKLRQTARDGLTKGKTGKALSALKFTDEKTAKMAILAFGRVEPFLIENLIQIWRAKSTNFVDKKGTVLLKISLVTCL